MIIFSLISNKIVPQALELFTHKTIFIMEKPKPNFQNLIKDTPKTTNIVK